jgi:uncharacterized integral membrane protein
VLLVILNAPSTSDFWHDPLTLTILSIVGGLVCAFIGAGVAYAIFRKQTSKKLISYEIVSNAPIATMNKTLQNTVTLQINGKTVNNARQVVLALRNQGNVAVEAANYDTPIKFVFLGSNVVGSDILATDPPELKNSINVGTLIQAGPDSVELEKILLNPNEKVAFTVLLDGDYKSLDISGRIIDGRIIKYVESALSRDKLLETILDATIAVVARRFKIFGCHQFVAL